MSSFLKRIIVFAIVLLIMGAVSPLSTVQYANATSINALEQKKKNNTQQIARIKRIKHQIILKERFVTTNILENQKRLESSKVSLGSEQVMMNQTKQRLESLESDLDVVLAQQQSLAIQVGKRLRSFYMGENTSFLHMLLDAGNLSSLMDRIFYKQRIVLRDRKLIKAYKSKTQILAEKKDDLIHEKNRLSTTIHSIRNYQSQLQESMVLDKILVEKLKTSREAYEMAENQLERESYAIERQIMSMTQHVGVVLGSTGRMMAPVIAAITSSFGYRFHPIFHTSRLHSGIDFGAHYGSAVHAADGGQVLQAGWMGGYGKAVIINHGSKGGQNVSTLYGHMSAIAVSTGQQIHKGQVVGFVGSTGFSTGPHLHFEVRINGRPVNPLGYLR